MKNASVFACKVLLGIILCALLFLPYGCGSSENLGETASERHRRHLRNLRLNQQQLVEDVDKVLYIDKPSRLTDKRIP